MQTRYGFMNEKSAASPTFYLDLQLNLDCMADHKLKWYGEQESAGGQISSKKYQIN